MNFDEYQRAASRTAGTHQCLEERLANYALGICGEAGEVSEYIKKNLFHGRPIDKLAVVKELGDVLWYLAALAGALDLDLSHVAAVNINKLNLRYPEGFRPSGIDGGKEQKP